MLTGGYITIHRKITEWSWYKNTATKCVFLHLLLTSNYEPKQFENIVVQRGQRIASFGTLAQETGLSIRQVRTAIEHLKSSGEVTSKSNNKYTVFSVVNYDSYQNVQQTDRQSNDIQMPNDRQSNDNNGNKAINNNKAIKQKNNSFCAANADTKKVFLIFEKLWNEYPEKRNKSNVSFTQRKKIEKIGYNKFHNAIQNYIDQKPVWQERLMNGDKFFNKAFEDYLDISEQTDEGVKKKKWQ